ncbi:MAG: hypothetical protein M3416_03745 [Acidobacteriota bacterium]|nr:hypothetical protein [Acidobacteriota bacterium]
MSDAQINLEEYFRRLAREEALKVYSENADAARGEWVSVRQAAELTSLSPAHVRKYIKKLQAKDKDHPDIYQPNGPGSQPLRLRRSALRNLRAA